MICPTTSTLPPARPTVCAVICAAGSGSRAGFERNKLFVPYEGIPVLIRTVQSFSFEGVDEIVVVHSKDDFLEMQSLLSDFNDVRLVEGGNTRAESVYNALQTVKSEIVLIHDGARPFITREIIEGCIDSVKKHGSGICSIPCTDTMAIKTTTNQILHAPDRDLLVHIQTPQGFYTKDILTAYQKATEREKQYDASCVNEEEKENGQIVQIKSLSQYTDDSSIYLDFITSPHLCPGARENRKLTYKEDFLSISRVGFGVDTHAFGKPQEYIVLAGVEIPSISGLIAHSDGDVLTHALMDALLSAAGLRDIGYYFPDTDDQWRGASSLLMLQRVHGMLIEQNLQVQNLSIAVQAERPKLAKYIENMKENLANVLEITPAQIGITAGTNEGLGYVGEGKGITVHAVALLKSRTY